MEKKEFYKIVHPDDLPHLLENFKVAEDKKTASVRFRGVRRDKKVIDIENYICHIEYNNKTAYLSSYIELEDSYEEETYIPKTIKITSNKKIVLDYHPDIMNLLKEHNLKFNIIKHCSYREEN